MPASVHVVARADALQPPLAASLRDAIRADAAAGRTVRVVLLHDAVARAAWVRAIPEVDAVHLREDDCRRRGVDAPDALDDAGIVALLAAAERVASW